MESISIFPRARKLKKTALLILALLLAAGSQSCGKYVLHYVYNNADSFAMKSANKYLDLSDAEEDRLRSLIQKHHRWHRRSELPRYLSFVNKLKVRGADGITNADIDWAMNNIDGYTNRIYNRIFPDTINVLHAIDSGRLYKMEKKMRDSNRELVAKTKMSKRERLFERTRKMIGYMEDWLGDISKDQKRQFVALSLKLPDITPSYLRYRRQRQHEFIQLLKSKPDKTKIRQKLNKWLVHRERNLPAYYKRDYMGWKRQLRVMILKIDKIITPQQRQHALTKLAKLRSDFRPLVR